MEAFEGPWATFTAFLYDQRLAVLIASIAGLVVGSVVASRRGWSSAARRHPGRTVAVTGIVLAIGLPLGWYLASPLVIRTELVEPAPVAAGAIPTSIAVAFPTAAPATKDSTASAVPQRSPTATPFEAASLAKGRFHGSDDFHFGRGTASIVEVEPGRYHLRLEDFSVRNGPDLYVYLSPSATGYAKGALELGKLKATDGSFGYDLPSGVDPGDFESAIIWCKQFEHLFATAPFEA